MATSKQGKDCFAQADIRLCRLRLWPEFKMFGFQLFKRSSGLHSIGIIESNSPAAASGLKIGDAIVKVNQFPVREMQYEPLVKLLKQIIKTNKTVELLVVPENNIEVLNNGLLSIPNSAIHVLETPSSMPSDYREYFTLMVPRVCKLTLRDKEKVFGMEIVPSLTKVGAYVQEIMPNSAASRGGLRKFDRVVEVDGVNLDQQPGEVIKKRIQQTLSKKTVQLVVADTRAYAYGVLNEPYSELDLHSNITLINSNHSEAPIFKSQSFNSHKLATASNDIHHLPRSISQEVQQNHSRTTPGMKRTDSKTPLLPPRIQRSFTNPLLKQVDVPALPELPTIETISTQISEIACEPDENDDHPTLSNIQFRKSAPNQYDQVEESYERPPPIPPRSKSAKFTKSTNIFSEQVVVKNGPIVPIKSKNQDVINEFKKQIRTDVNRSRLFKRFYDVEDEPLRILSPIEGYENVPILNLTEAVNGLENIISNLNEHLDLAINESQSVLNELTANESAAIYFFKLGSKIPICESLNNALRDDDRSRLKPFLSYFKLLLSALWKSPSLKTEVWRASPADLRLQYPVGKSFVWWGFSSCSESRHYIEYKKWLEQVPLRTLFHISCKHGKSISSGILPNKKVEDILLLPGSQFRVTNSTETDGNVTIIQVEEIEPEFSFIQSPFELPKISGELKIFKDFLYKSKNEIELTISKHKFIPEHLKLLTGELKENQTWQKITIQKSPFDVNLFGIFVEGLKSKSSISELNLDSNELNDSMIAILVNAIADNSTIKALNISDNKISHIGGRPLADLLFINKTLSHLNVAFNAIGDQGTILMINALKSCTLSPSQWLQANNDYLEVQAYNEIDPYIIRADEAYLDIDQAMRIFRPLAAINLSGNNLTHHAADEIGQLLASSTCRLIELNLSYNSLKNLGIHSLMRGLQNNKTLIKLYLDQVDMADEGAEAVAKILKTNSTLEYLSLRKNNLNNERMDKISDGLKRNISLMTIDLSENCLSDPCLRAISIAMATNKTLSSVILDNNQCSTSPTSLLTNSDEERECRDF